jgi:hypothetical protein
MGIWVDGKDGFSERGVTCYPREINVFVAGGRKSTAGEGERVEIKDESVLVQRGRFRFVPKNGIKPQGEIISEQWGRSPTTPPPARQPGPIRKRRLLARSSVASAAAAGGVDGEEEEERGRVCSRFTATLTLRFLSFCFPYGL